MRRYFEDASERDVPLGHLLLPLLQLPPDLVDLPVNLEQLLRLHIIRIEKSRVSRQG
jgi:hypothetical protein